MESHCTRVCIPLLLLSVFPPACVPSSDVEAVQPPAPVLAQKRPWEIAAEEMERRSGPIVVDETGQLRLASYRGWVYLQDAEGAPFRRLLPGRFPQWRPRHKGQQDRWFYVFLYPGYDWGHEPWLGSTAGHFLGRLASKPVFVTSTPVVSPDENTLACVVRPLCRVMEGTTGVTMVRMPGRVEDPAMQEHWRIRCPSHIENLSFVDNDTVEFEVVDDEGRQTRRMSIDPPE